MDISYQILFSIELSHEYFIDKKARNVSLAPTKATQNAFDKLGLLWRRIDHKLIVLIKENASREPFMNRSSQKLYRASLGKTTFKFYLKTTDSYFLNYTNIELQSNELLYFNNLADNIPSDGKEIYYLSQKIEEYNDQQKYLPGEYVVEPSTHKVYEALKIAKDGESTDFNNETLWQLKGNVQLPTTKDQIEYTTSFYNYLLLEETQSLPTKIFGFNFDSNHPDFDKLIKEVDSSDYERSSDQVKRNLQSLPPGRYKLNINNEQRMIYYDPYITRENPLGVVEIFNHLPAANSYSFLDSKEQIQSKNYVLQFPLRSVLWKYIRKDNTANQISDEGHDNYTFKLENNEFTSEVPIPLSQNTLDTLKLDFNTESLSLSPLPNPSGNRLGRHHQDEYDYLCAAMHLNY